MVDVIKFTKVIQNMSNFTVSTVPADGPVGTSAATVMTKFGLSGIYILSSINCSQMTFTV